MPKLLNPDCSPMGFREEIEAENKKWLEEIKAFQKQEAAEIVREAQKVLGEKSEHGEI